MEGRHRFLVLMECHIWKCTTLKDSQIKAAIRQRILLLYVRTAIVNYITETRQQIKLMHYTKRSVDW